MFWVIGVLGLAFLVLYSTKRRPRASRRSAAAISPGVALTMEIVRPNPEDWTREREARRRARQATIERLRSSFVRPTSVSAAFVGIQAVLHQLAQAHGRSPPDLELLWDDVQRAGEPRKVELAIRKKVYETYKLRADPARLVESLTYCLLHVRLLLEYRDPKWKVSATIKRLVVNLNHEKGRSSCLGFLYDVADALRETNPEIAELCDREIDRLFNSWVYDDEAKTRYEADLARLPRAALATDKHFILNGLVEYLDRRRRSDPATRSKLIELCEEDVRLYKSFLADFADVGRTSFKKAVESPHYFCPRLPSFDALWDLYEEEANVGELRRLQRLAREIKYGDYEIDESTATQAQEETEGAAKAVPDQIDPCPVEVIQVARSGQKGKLAFLDSAGEPCSTEEAAEDYFRQSGFKTLRGEVQFWQAMFGLAFWEEIFSGTGAPDGVNDIPTDLFAGERFYASRRAAIDTKAGAIARSNLQEFMLGQLRRHGNSWTRIVFDGGRGDFSYRDVLQSAGVSEFLTTISPAVFAKIVHRIASNPNENRAGLPDYMIWKEGITTFIEVKGIREKIRKTQMQWLRWLQAEGISVKLVRVRG